MTANLTLNRGKKHLLPYWYDRVSSKDQVVTGRGLGVQRSQIVQCLDRNADKFADERIFITDEGVSAFKDANISPESNLGLWLLDVRDSKVILPNNNGHATK